MTPSETMVETLAAWKPTGTGRQTWAHSFPAEGWEVALSADRADTVGCVAQALCLTRTGPAPAGATTRAWAERIVERVTGLLEPLKVVEIDHPGAEALIRSGPPTRKAGRLGYYEMRLTGTSRAEFRRYEADVGASGSRVPVGFALTHEVLGKLVEDVMRD